MKKWIIGGSVLAVLVAYVAHIFISTGYFRSIENRFDGEVVKKVGIHGVEDMQVNHEEGYLILSSDDRAARRDGHPAPGHLYYMDLKIPGFMPIQLTADLEVPFFPHGISLDTHMDETRLYAINHVDNSHSIEVFQWQDDRLVHEKSLRDPTMVSPNDVVGVGKGRFYFTNDHKYTEGLAKWGEEYLAWEVSNVVYFDGSAYREVASGIGYANGINVDMSRNLLYVAAVRSFEVKVYRILPGGDLEFVENIDCGTGVDNIDIAPDGTLWIGAHPSLLAFAAYAKGSSATSPSEIITIDYRGEGDYTIESVYMNDGSEMSSASVAAPYNDLIFAGNVMDNHFLVLRKR